MKTIKLFITITLLTFVTSNAQITKGNWMVGGSGSFSSSNTKSENFSETKTFTIDISPNIGYFVIDKLAFGSKVNFFKSNSKSDTGNSDFKTFYVSPFARYFFLNKEKKINVFLESSYKFSMYKENSKNTALSFKGGTAIFLNSSVALEISLEYLKNNYSNNQNTNSILLGIGVQVHLEKEK